MENKKSVMFEKANQYIGALGNVDRSDMNKFASLIKEMAEKNNRAIITESSLQVELSKPLNNNIIKKQYNEDILYAGTNNEGDKLFYVPLHIETILSGKIRLFDIVICCLVEDGENYMMGYTMIPRTDKNKLAKTIDYVYNLSLDKKDTDLSKDILKSYTKLVAEICNININRDIDNYIEIFNRLLASAFASMKEKGVIKDDGTPYSMGYDCIDTAITYYRNDKKFKYVIIADSVLHMIKLIGVPYDENPDNIKSLDFSELEVTKDNVNDDSMSNELHYRLKSILEIADYKPLEDKGLYDVSKIIASGLHDKLKGKYM